MKKSISTFLKHPTKDSTNRSANPPVTRASTILFNSVQEMYQHELKIKKHKKISHYTYGRYGSTTTIELENILKELDLNPDIVNVNGGAIALGHPLGCTGAKLSVQLFNEMRRRKQRYGMVTMCVGTGQGAAGIYELLK